MSDYSDITNQSAFSSAFATLGVMQGDVIGYTNNNMIANNVIGDMMIAGNANISDTKLATIQTANKVLPSAISTLTASATATSVMARGSKGETAVTDLVCTTINGLAPNTGVNFTGQLKGDIIGTQFATQIASGVIVDADISNSAAVTDLKLATITTAGKVANSATSAATAATPNTIALRDTYGNLTANELYASTFGQHISDVVGNVKSDTYGDHYGKVKGDVIGNATTATSFTANLKGDVNSIGMITTIPADSITIDKLKQPSGNAGTAVSTNSTPYTIALRDGYGNITTTSFYGDTFGLHTGAVNGNVIGNLKGDVIGNVTGNLTGNVTGNLKGDVNGNVTGNLIGDFTGDIYATNANIENAYMQNIYTQTFEAPTGVTGQIVQVSGSAAVGDDRKYAVTTTHTINGNTYESLPSFTEILDNNGNFGFYQISYDKDNYPATFTQYNIYFASDLTNYTTYRLITTITNIDTLSWIDMFVSVGTSQTYPTTAATFPNITVNANFDMTNHIVKNAITIPKYVASVNGTALDTYATTFVDFLSLIVPAGSYMVNWTALIWVGTTDVIAVALNIDSGTYIDPLAYAINADTNVGACFNSFVTTTTGSIKMSVQTTAGVHCQIRNCSIWAIPVYE